MVHKETWEEREGSAWRDQAVSTQLPRAAWGGEKDPGLQQRHSRNGSTEELEQPKSAWSETVLGVV